MTADVVMNGQEDSKNPHLPLYEGSTQYRHWRFSPEQLTDIRTSLNAAAVTAIRDAFEADSAGQTSPQFFWSHST